MAYNSKRYRDLDEPGAGGGNDESSISRERVRQALNKEAAHPGDAGNAAGMSHEKHPAEAPESGSNPSRREEEQSARGEE